MAHCPNGSLEWRNSLTKEGACLVTTRGVGVDIVVAGLHHETWFQQLSSGIAVSELTLVVGPQAMDCGLPSTGGSCVLKHKAAMGQIAVKEKMLPSGHHCLDGGKVRTHWIYQVCGLPME